MELNLKPYHKNLHPVVGLLIKSPSPLHWVKQMQKLDVTLHQAEIYPLPGATANSIWGCLIFLNDVSVTDAGANAFCQLAENILFLPEHALLYPTLLSGELQKLLKNKKHILHPEIGFYELGEALNPCDLITLPKEKAIEITSPLASAFIPLTIRSYQVKNTEPEQLLRQMEAQFPEGKKFEEKPLNPLEHLKLFFYRQILGSGQGSEGSVTDNSILARFLNRLGKLLSKDDVPLSEKMQADLADLERRNEKHLDKLLAMLRDNPTEALKYALPLDENGSSRGGVNGIFKISHRWLDFSLFGNSASGSGSAAFSGDAYMKLQAEYQATARRLIAEKEYRKAAFVYMKLLKNPYEAATCLEQGELYQEAAIVYQKYCNNISKAAECYEKARMIQNAIDLYKEIGDNEKIGDLYALINNRKEALRYYKIVADNYISNHKYLKASFVYGKKMQDQASAQEILLQGWRKNLDAFNCLNNYLANIDNEKAVAAEIMSLYHNEVTPVNSQTFLRILTYEFEKAQEVKPLIKDLAHQIIVSNVKNDPSIITYLKSFGKSDKLLLKDTLRFKLNIQKNKIKSELKFFPQCKIDT